MKIRIIPKEKQSTRRWSGGTTTELFLWPPGGSYEKRDFLCRVSTAECLDRESVFTSLPGTDRILAILDGEIRLRHDEGSWYTLIPGMQTCFTGEEKTESRGTCVDFNLMMKGGTKGTIRFHQMAFGETKTIAAGGDFLILYQESGQTEISAAEERDILHEHDACWMDLRRNKAALPGPDARGKGTEQAAGDAAPDPARIFVRPDTDSILVAVRVFLRK